MNQISQFNVKSLTEVGEDIGLEEGARLVKAFVESNPNATLGYYIGRNIIEQILAQPDCVGINFRKCLSDENEEHLVYTGVDSDGQDILEYSVATSTGDIHLKSAIVADRSSTIEIDGDTLEEILKKILGK